MSSHAVLVWLFFLGNIGHNSDSYVTFQHSLPVVQYSVDIFLQVGWSLQHIKLCRLHAETVGHAYLFIYFVEQLQYSQTWCLQKILSLVWTNENHLELSLDCMADVVTVPSLSLQFCLLRRALCGGALLCWRMTPFSANPVAFCRLLAAGDQTAMYSNNLHSQYYI